MVYKEMGGERDEFTSLTSGLIKFQIEICVMKLDEAILKFLIIAVYYVMAEVTCTLPQSVSWSALY